jgi:hypothetical protein
MTISKKARYEIDGRIKGEREVRGLSNSLKETEGVLGSVGKSMVAANIATGVLSKAFSALKGAIGDTVQDALDFQDWVTGNEAAVTAMNSAVGGMISKLDLARSAAKLTTGDFQLNERQLKAVSKAAVEYARINKQEFAPSLRAVTDAITAGRSRVFKDMGYAIDFIGTGSQKSAQALKLLEEKFGDASVEAQNVNEQLAIMKSSVRDTASQMGAAILDIDFVKNSIEGLTQQIKGATDAINTFSRTQGTFWQRFKQAAVMHAITTAAGKLSPEARELLEQAAAGVTGATIPEAASERAGGAGGVKPRPDPRRPDPRRRPSPTNEFLEAYLKGVEGFGDGGELPTREGFRGEGQELGGLTGPTASIFADMSAELETLHGGLTQGRDDWQSYQQAMADNAIAAEEVTLGLQNTVASGLQPLAAGMWDAIDAALAGRASFGQAMAAMTKSVLMGISKQAFIRAIFHVAAGLGAQATTWGIPNLSSTGHFAAAAKYGTVAAIAGAGGAMIGRAAATGGSASAARAAGGASVGQSPGSRPSVGRDRRRDDQQFKPTINVYLDAQNPAAGLQWKKEIKAIVAEAA